MGIKSSSMTCLRDGLGFMSISSAPSSGAAGELLMSSRVHACCRPEGLCVARGNVGGMGEDPGDEEVFTRPGVLQTDD